MRLRTFHPLALCLFPVLHLGGSNLENIELRALLAPALLSLAGTSAVFGLLWSLRRDLERSALMTSLLLVLFFGYGPLFEWLWAMGSFDTLDTAYAVSLGVVAVVAVAGLWYLWRRPANTEPLMLGASVAALSLLATSGGTTLMNLDTHSGMSPVRSEGQGIPDASPSPPIMVERADLPDIYYIILDGYPRADAVAQYYDFDNSPFLRALRRRGFYIADASQSNYSMTFLSLASSLNMRYVAEEIDALQRTGSRRRQPFYEMIQRSGVAQYLRARGYRYATIPTGWVGTDKSPLADIEYNYAPILGSEFYKTLMRSTALRPLAPSLANAHLYAFEAVKEIAHIEGPIFAFVHIILPHLPFVFTRDGQVRRDLDPKLRFFGKYRAQMGNWDDKDAFVDQLVYLNRRMLEVVDEIIAASDSPPVIILQGDHGTALTAMNPLGGSQRPNPYERFAILNAYLVPDAARRELSRDITPVNTFRVILRALFDLPLERLPDQSIDSWYGDPYSTRDVTELLRRSAGGQARDATDPRGIGTISEPRYVR
jgi:hypothetical protein